jgi:hypothetical protein
MGYMRHHAIIVSSWSKEEAEKAYNHAVEIFGKQVTALTPEAMNGYVSFLVPPDGSKEGWEESDAGDVRRSELKAFLRSLAYEDGSTSVNWVEVLFNDDEDEESICDSDRKSRTPDPAKEKQ